MKIKFLFLMFSVILCSPDIAFADKQDDVLNTVIDSANKLCGSVPLVGTQQNVDLNLDAKVTTGSFVKRMLTITGNANADYNKKNFEGLTQEQLIIALKDERGCKIHMVEFLLKSTNNSSSLILDNSTIEGFDKGASMQPGDKVLLKNGSKLKGTGNPGSVGVEFKPTENN